jgi:hypothetical protein
MPLLQIVCDEFKSSDCISKKRKPNFSRLKKTERVTVETIEGVKLPGKRKDLIKVVVYSPDG